MASVSTQPRTFEYRESTTLYDWTRRSLYTLLAISACAVVVSLGVSFGGPDLLRSDLWVVVLGLLLALQLGVFAWSGVQILMWIHRASANARAMGAQGMKIGPGWAVGYYFVPILYLWKPYSALKEIWLASSTPSNWQSQPVPGLLALWWALWLVGCVLWDVLGKAMPDDPDLIFDYNSLILYSIASASSLALCVVFLRLMKGLRAIQSSRAQTGRVHLVSRP
jgi:hypothetical protein